MQCEPASLYRPSWACPVPPSLCSSSRCISFSLSPCHVVLSFVSAFPHPLRRCRSSQFGLLKSCELPDFDRHIRRYSSRPGRRRNLAGDRIGALRSGDVNDPVAQEKLLRLGENSVRDRDAIFLAAHHLSFLRPG